MHSKNATLAYMKLQRPASRQPIPNTAKKVFAGKIFDVYQWQQKMFDGTYEVFEKVKRPDSVIVFGVFDNGDILLTKQAQPGKQAFIGAAGGIVDDGEDILLAAKRELLEETGYEAEHFELWHSEQPSSKIEWAVYVFIAKGLKKVAEQHLDAGEKIQTMRVPFTEFLEIGLRPDFYEKEIVKFIYQAKIDPDYYDSLRNLFSAAY